MSTINGQTKLKIKAKSLSSEQKDIRLEELKHKWSQKAARARASVKERIAKEQGTPWTGPWPDGIVTDTSSLYFHRLGLRKELRSTHLARGFLRGLAYRSIENFSYTQPDWNRVERLVEKYGDNPTGSNKADFSQWMETAMQGFNGRVYRVEKDERHPGSGRDKAWIDAQNSHT